MPVCASSVHFQRTFEHILMVKLFLGKTKLDLLIIYLQDITSGNLERMVVPAYASVRFQRTFEHILMVKLFLGKQTIA
jgi:hypothetical protein